jgi:nitroimidazol reductase NimA-like FMN-containing flavoprotein (pyridoxamine 5'-phosphate oxidase superfamily)/GNAT superfamily N-acetyltransferase
MNNADENDQNHQSKIENQKLPMMLRLYSSGDLYRAVRLFTDTVHIIGGRYYSSPEVEAWAPSNPDTDTWRTFFEDRHTVVAESGGKITGFGCLNPGGNTIDMLFTHHEHQNEGIGTSIMDALEAEALKRGSQAVFLTTSATAWKFYLNRGYSYFESRKKRYGDVVFDCQILRKALAIFPVLRRKDRIMDEEAARQLLEKGEYGFLAMKAVNGYGYGIPVSYVAKGENIYFHGAPDGFKIENIKNDNRVSFCVVGKTRIIPEEFTTVYESVLVFGRISYDLPEKERYGALDLLVKKYSPDYVDISKSYITKSFHRTSIFRLETEHISGKCKRVNLSAG